MSLDLFKQENIVFSLHLRAQCLKSVFLLFLRQVLNLVQLYLKLVFNDVVG